MPNESKGIGVVRGALIGAHSATGSAPSAAAEVKRWSAGRKKPAVLRLPRGEAVDALSRELAVPIVRLKEWRDRTLAGIDAGLKERGNDPLEKPLDEANCRIGKWVMEVEILRKERRRAAVGSAGGRRDEPDGLAGHWQALRPSTGLLGAGVSPLDPLRPAGPGSLQRRSTAPGAPRAEAEDCRTLPLHRSPAKAIARCGRGCASSPASGGPRIASAA